MLNLKASELEAAPTRSRSSQPGGWRFSAFRERESTVVELTIPPADLVNRLNVEPETAARRNFRVSILSATAAEANDLDHVRHLVIQSPGPGQILLRQKSKTQFSYRIGTYVWDDLARAGFDSIATSVQPIDITVDGEQAILIPLPNLLG